MSSKSYNPGLGPWLSIIHLAAKSTGIMDAISKATPAQIADMLKTYQTWRMELPPYDGANCQPYSPKELNAIIDRAIELLKEKE